MKKILAFALVLAMTMALSLSVCAATIEGDDRTASEVITITNSISGDGATVYKVDVEWTNTFSITTVGKWDPESHTYVGDTSGATSTLNGTGNVKVTNHTNKAITATLTFDNVDSNIEVEAGAPINLADASQGDSYGNPSKAPTDNISITATLKNNAVIETESISFEATVTIS